MYLKALIRTLYNVVTLDTIVAQICLMDISFYRLPYAN